jgi:hypothetical protein
LTRKLLEEAGQPCKIGLNPPSKRKEKKRKEKTTEVEGF